MKWSGLILLPVVCGAQTWLLQDSGVTASLRGLSAVDGQVVWASGAEGTWLRTTDGGKKWLSGKVTGGETLDFRGIHAFSANEAVAMSSGEGALSRVFSTTDGGAHWLQIFANPDAKGFFDGIAFSNRRNGVLMGDPVDGRFGVFVTSDGGQTWNRRQGPEANPGEASFAASNSTVGRRGNAEIWIASGGKGGARFFRSADGGTTWHVTQTPVRHDLETAGIFSVAWRGGTAVAAGGDYKHDTEGTGNAAMTQDGGRTWRSISGPAGFRSAVVYVASEKVWVATGTSGSDISKDGTAWRTFDDGAFNALSGLWAVGPRGRIAKFHMGGSPR